jgi:hypothetical protein
MKTYGGGEVQLHFTEGSRQLHNPAVLHPGKEPYVPIG